MTMQTLTQQQHRAFLRGVNQELRSMHNLRLIDPRTRNRAIQRAGSLSAEDCTGISTAEVAELVVTLVNLED